MSYYFSFWVYIWYLDDCCLSILWNIVFVWKCNESSCRKSSGWIIECTRHWTQIMCLSLMSVRQLVWYSIHRFNDWVNEWITFWCSHYYHIVKTCIWDCNCEGLVPFDNVCLLCYSCYKCDCKGQSFRDSCRTICLKSVRVTPSDLEDSRVFVEGDTIRQIEWIVWISKVTLYWKL